MLGLLFSYLFSSDGDESELITGLRSIFAESVYVSQHSIPSLYVAGWDLASCLDRHQ